MAEQCDVVVIGGGLVGLATAAALVDAGRDVAVVEKEGRLGAHQSGRNSGVLHSGLYYRPGSLKARLCGEGRRRMLAFCEAEGLPARVTGKLVVAATPAEIPRLEDLHRRGEANGLAGIERLGPGGIRSREPHAAGVAALWVPETGVTDFAAVAARLGERLAAGGAAIATGARVDAVAVGDDGVTVRAGERVWEAGAVVNCAGLHADTVARMAGDEPPARIVPFRGEYHVLTGEAAGMVRGLLYPVPDPRFPFLGVHFTRGVDGRVEVGPNAVLALGREHYRGSPADLRGLAEALGYRGFRRLAARNLAGGVGEALRSRSTRLYARRARRLLPALRAAHLRPGGSGVRAQAVFPDGRLADDFVLSGSGRAVHVLSAPSPAATAALPIGEHLAALVAERI
ncbi:MAG: L-2-hydroxyglutarate oxidase [Actinobacteria bacterium]|nr:L-2-hydroxyglutarate oxidase [Actinomycetota bacterium]